MFSDCLEYINKASRDLFSFKEGDKIVTYRGKFKYLDRKATVIGKQIFPGGFNEAQLVRIQYDGTEEFDVLDCSFESFLAKPAE